MFQVGELIVYGSEGVCRVDAIGAAATAAADARRLYYTLSPLYHAGTIFIPVDSGVFMRPILSRREAEALIRKIPEICTSNCGSANLRVLSEHYQSLLRSHSCEDLVCLIKTVYRKRKEAFARGRKCGQVEENFFRRAEEMLHGELAASLEIDRAAVPAYIADTLSALQSRG